jgi:hypothetical protein
VTYLNFFLTANRSASIFTLLSTVLLGIKIFLLNSIPAFSGVVYELGVVLDGLLISIIASYIFYLFTVHLKELNTKRLTYPYLYRKTFFVISECEKILRDIERQANMELMLDEITSEELKFALSKISFDSSAPLKIGPIQANWKQYLDYHEDRTKNIVSQLFSRIGFLEPEHIVMLDAIQESPHINTGSSLRSFLIGNPDLSAYGATLYHYCEKCLELKKYMEKRENP